MDVASALDYIHNHCIPTIVHGDLKPSNILLDDDMVAHIGDFGLARFLGTSYPYNSTGIRGTVGYALPVIIDFHSYLFTGLETGRTELRNTEYAAGNRTTRRHYGRRSGFRVREFSETPLNGNGSF
uniref:Protein kinase domain-containing protein n=1 Tax=Helianthus annuus TaxID=4232 RepID=A0A251UEP2_HELAN